MPLTPTYTSTNIRGMDLPYTAEAILAYNNMDKGSTADQKIKPPGFINGGCPYHHQRGHMIGMKLGGDGGMQETLLRLLTVLIILLCMILKREYLNMLKQIPG